jgi:hypothetical protein
MRHSANRKRATISPLKSLEKIPDAQANAVRARTYRTQALPNSPNLNFEVRKTLFDCLHKSVVVLTPQ